LSVSFTPSRIIQPTIINNLNFIITIKVIMHCLNAIKLILVQYHQEGHFPQAWPGQQSQLSITNATATSNGRMIMNNEYRRKWAWPILIH
jgi:hypothetical protein